MTPSAENLAEPIAKAPILLVACDFDGTMSEIADHPELARPCNVCLSILRELAALPRTYAAVVSGRSLEDLRRVLPKRGRIMLVGGHGAEPEFAPMAVGSAGSRADDLTAGMNAIAARYPGVLIEPKPAGPALHYRHVEPDRRPLLLTEARQLAERLNVAPLRHGILVVEFPVVRADKGAALTILKDRCAAANVLFMGDDLTDEDAFAILKPPDLGVKVGAGVTKAQSTVADVNAVRELLRYVLSERRALVQQQFQPAIDSHAFLSDQRSFALADERGRIVWLGAPRADSPPIFAALLGGRAAGHFEISPAAANPSDTPPVARMSYAPDSFLSRTHFPTFTITDYLDTSAGRAFQRAGRTDLLRVVEGSGPVCITFAPRLNFGRVPTRMTTAPEGLVIQGSVDPMVLHSKGINWTIQPDGVHHTAKASIDIPLEGIVLEMRIGSGSLGAPPLPESKRRAATEAFWTGWVRTLRPVGIHDELVRRSALVIKALCHGPTGAILAAGTTSLPEQLGGVRNWDYRFCWVRDAALSASALVRLGSTGHAMKYLDWLIGVVEDLDTPERLRPIYTASGHELGPEGEVAELRGYARSRPVRIGNGAGHQVQLDVFGPVAELIHLLAQAAAPLTPEHRTLLDAMVEAVARRWKEPDNGIWEIRGPLRHHVHSKVLCWQTVNRAILTRQFLGEPPRDEEILLAKEIRDDVLAKGFNEKLNTFTASYASEDLDAACLLIGLSGLVSPTDPRFVGTVRAIEAALRVNDGVMRYIYDDGLPGQEGVFHLCTGWLIESLHLIGEPDRARALLDAYVSHAGPLGLYSEERDPYSGEPLGNYPQAYSHLALINACTRLAGA